MTEVTYIPAEDSFETSDYNSSNFLFNACFMITKRCNFKCIHCSQDAYNPDQQLDIYKKYIDKLKESGLIRINVSGGEPLLYEQLPEFLKYCKNLGITITLSTNGFLLPAKLHFIKPYVDNIRINIYGIGGTHDKFTKQPGSFEKLKETLSLLKMEGIPVLMVMPTAQRNLSEIQEVIKFCESYGVKKLRFFTLINMGRAESIFSFEALTQDDIFIIEKIIKEYNQISPKILLKLTDWTKDSTTCFIIEPNGECWFYFANKKEKVGSLITDSISDIWNNFCSKELVNYLFFLH